MPMIDWAIRIALNINHLAVLDIDIQTTANCTVGTHTMKKLRIADAWSLLNAFLAERLYSRTNLHYLRDGTLHRCWQQCTFLHRSTSSIYYFRKLFVKYPHLSGLALKIFYHG